MLRVLGTLWIVLILSCSLGGLAWYRHASRDLEPPDWGDLALPEITVKPEDDAAGHLQRVAELLQPFSEELLQLRSDLQQGKLDLARVEPLLRKTEPALVILAEGLRRPNLSRPLLKSPLDQDPDLVTALQVGYLLHATMLYEEGRRNWQAMQRSASNLLILGDRIQANSNTLLEHLVGLALIQKAVVGVRKCVSKSDLDVEQVRYLANAVRLQKSVQAGAARSARGDFLFRLRTLQSCRQNFALACEVVAEESNGNIQIFNKRNQWVMNHLAAVMFHPNRSATLIERCYRAAVQNATKVFAEADRVLNAECGAPSRQPRMGMFEPNSGGTLLMQIMWPDFRSAAISRCLVESSMAATEIGAAIKLFHRVEGRMPERLEELVPRFLDRVPADPFDGHEFRYLPAKGVVYTVGQNLKDDGGNGEVPSLADGGSIKDQRDDPDLVYSIAPH